MSHFTLVEAPQIPTSERVALEKHIREAVLDSDYTLVTNYEMQFTVIERLPFNMLIVNANGIPGSEVSLLRDRVKAALVAENPEDKFVVVNYECLIYTVPQNGNHAETYGGISDPEPEETKLGHEEVEALVRNTFAELVEEQNAEKTDETGDEEDS